MKSAAAILLLAATCGFAHRLDEYLQGTLIAVDKNRIDAQMTLTPGVAVFPLLIAEIDLDSDGVISRIEQQAYAARVLGDLSIAIDGHPLTLRLLSVRFPTIEEMKEGRGEIRIEFDADLPSGGPNRKLTFKNRHQSKIAAYQVNSLVPSSRDIRILAQNRNYTQSFYELEFVEGGAGSTSSGGAGTPVGIMLVCGASLALLWQLRDRYRLITGVQPPSTNAGSL
jgi:hypothetical protein